MASPLTVASIEKLKPDPQRRREIPDARMPGLYLIIQPTGAKSWAVRYRYAGRSRKFTIGPYPAFDLAAARQEASQALQQAQRGGDPACEKRLERQTARLRGADGAPDNFESLVRLFIERYAKKKNRGWQKIARVLGLVVPNDEPDTLAVRTGDRPGLVAKWGERKIGDIRKVDVILLLDDIADRAPVQANRTLSHLRKIFNWAIERDLIAVNPCAGVKPPGTEIMRVRKLTGDKQTGNDDELKAIWRTAAATSWPFGPILQLLILTGQRRGEVAGMRWSELDLDNKLWTIPAERAKNKTTHMVPLSEAAVEIISRVPRVKNVDMVFSTTGSSTVSGFSRAKRRLDKATGIRDWRLHDLRRTVASGMQRLGIKLEVTEKVLNHRSGSFGGIVGVYQQHDYADETRAALDAWGRFVIALASDKPAANVVALHKAHT
jgi:integrase